ncbi:MAG: nucleotidyltransferase [Flavipsychrobacter sp.]
MPNYSEQIIANWTNPASNTEEEKLSNAERMVREALTADDTLRQKSIEVFGQGSYANNTNVRLNSDIDINACYKDGFYYDLPNEATREDYEITPTEYTFSQYKNDVERALVNKFGRDQVVRKNKCLRVLGNSYRTETDVVPTWEYRRYSQKSSYVTGVCFFSDEGKKITSYPKQHITNGRTKNTNTYRRFKSLVRIYKKVRYHMIDNGEIVNPAISSFLLECLVWNVPNSIFTNNDSWTARLRESIVYLYNQTKVQDTCKDWGEVSELLYLFYDGRKWTYQDVNEHLVKMWNYIGYQ